MQIEYLVTAQLAFDLMTVNFANLPRLPKLKVRPGRAPKDTYASLQRAYRWVLRLRCHGHRERYKPCWRSQRRKRRWEQNWTTASQTKWASHEWMGSPKIVFTRVQCIIFYFPGIFGSPLSIDS